MFSAKSYRLPLGALLVVGALGCAAVPPLEEAPPEGGYAITAKTFTYRAGNVGRIVGTVNVTPEMLQWANATSIQGAVAQAFDPDGTPLNEKVSVDANGNFVMENLRESRPRIFIEADVNGLRFRSTMSAPRQRKDYPVVMDPGTTYLADKLRRAALDHDVAFDKLDEAVVDQTEEVVNTYMDDAQRRTVLEETNGDINAYAFDHFMDDNQPVKLAVYSLSPAILRGWKPPLPSSRPLPSPSLGSNTGPTPTPASPLPTPSPTPTNDAK